MRRAITDLLFATRFNRFEVLILLPGVSVLLNGGHYGRRVDAFLTFEQALRKAKALANG